MVTISVEAGKIPPNGGWCQWMDMCDYEFYSLDELVPGEELGMLLRILYER